MLYTFFYIYIYIYCLFRRLDVHPLVSTLVCYIHITHLYGLVFLLFLLLYWAAHMQRFTFLSVLAQNYCTINIMGGWQNLKNRVKNKIQPNHNVFYQVKQLSSLKSQLQMVQMGLLCLKRAGALEAVERSMRRWLWMDIDQIWISYVFHVHLQSRGTFQACVCWQIFNTECSCGWLELPTFLNTLLFRWSWPCVLIFHSILYSLECWRWWRVRCSCDWTPCWSWRCCWWWSPSTRCWPKPSTRRCLFATTPSTTTQSECLVEDILVY